MTDKLSEVAQKILDAGMAELSSGTGEEARARADKAIETAVGNLYIQYPRDDKIPLFDALTQIAQLYVRQTGEDDHRQVAAE